MSQKNRSLDASFVLSCCGTQQISELSRMVADVTSLSQGEAAERIYSALRDEIAAMLQEQWDKAVEPGEEDRKDVGNG